MSPTQQLLDYQREIDENQKQVREMVLKSYHDVATGKGLDYTEFFDELKYGGCMRHLNRRLMY